ncbi:MAG: sugar ABC transporter ATP-binding protein [Candidatus Limiplasma sp.]|nr:sugar ABC transporter ATP-binding protein [Candidatus Limiplasma sp.]
MSAEAILEFRHVGKTFPGVVALEDINVDLYPGEVHILVGENGAGKSTLMKVLSGAYTATSGELIFQGKRVEKNSPQISAELGISMIYQELNLVPELSVAANIFLGHELKNGPFVDAKAQERRAAELLTEIGIEVDPRTVVKNLGIGTRQMVEIAKALSRNAKVIVFDEPTSSLTDSEIAELFQIIRLLRERGVGMFYISHRLEELFQIGDRVSVLRDGRHILTDSIASLNMETLIENIAGRRIDNLFPHVRKPAGEAALEIRNLSGEKFREVNLTVRAGEIVGVAGLVGAGRSETVRAAFGIDRYASGEVRVRGQVLRRGSPMRANRLGMCLLPEDRKVEGLALPLSIRENMVVSSLRELNPSGLVSAAREREQVKGYVESLEIATSSMDKLVQFLSGGTQQKVVIAKWLLSQSQVFIFDEPTRGIDVGAKSSIYRLMDELVGRGAAILMISSDLTEILGMSDRIYVMSGGAVVGEMDREGATQQEILHLAFSNV